MNSVDLRAGWSESRQATGHGRTTPSERGNASEYRSALARCRPDAARSAVKTRLALDGDFRNSGVNKRMRAAGRLLQAAVEELREVEVSDFRSEFVRRDLELLSRALVSLVSELVATLGAMRLVDSDQRGLSHMLGMRPCPHCGWGMPLNRSGRCNRCGELCEVSLARAAPNVANEGRARG